MRIFSSLPEAESEEAGSRDPASDFWFTSLGLKTAAGVRITPQTSMTVAAVFACVRIIAETVGSVPCITYRRLDRGKDRAKDHDLYRLLRQQPNEQQTALEFFEMLTGHAALRGWSYAEKVFKGQRLEQLIPLHPDHMRCQLMENGRMHYLYRSPATGIEYRYLPEEIFHFRGFSLDPNRPMSVLEAASSAIGTARAADDYAARFFANDASPRGVLTHPEHFADKERRDQFRKQWQAAQSGANRHKTAILEDGMKYEQLGLSNADSQLIESRRYQIADIARFFRVPLVLLGETEKSTSWGSGIEQFMLAFVTHTMRPWFVRWEQRLQADLFSEDKPTGDDEYFAEFLIDALMRGDMKARYEAYSKAINDGWMVRNEARDRENLNPLEGLDEPLQPMNMQGATEDAQQQAPKRNREQTEGVDESDDRAAQIVRKEVAALSRFYDIALRGKGEGEARGERLAELVTDFYGTQVTYVRDKLGISLSTAISICADGKREALDAITQELQLDQPVFLDAIASWEPHRAHEIARKVRNGNG